MVRGPDRPSVFNGKCGSQQVLGLIADRWTALVIHALAKGTQRYSQLQRTIGGVSQKMLTQTLRNLERNGLVDRQVYPVVPPKVEYSLTPLGRTLIEPLRALCEWAEKHLEDLEEARARHEGPRPVKAARGA
ncbi:MAG TPA: helix-turn-helix domain-containing protein [Candidatus Methylomirabilis sp.]|nr:helix-turn-helix domain-containing protein [Candidatus Methylomirabilis sp.]